MSVKTRLRISAVAAGAALATAAVTMPAQAAAPAGLSAAQQATTARIDGRLSALHALDTKVGAAKNLTSSDRSTLTSLVDSDLSALTALRSKVAGETTVEAVHADATSMVDDYRVYLLVEPKVHLTDAFDIEAAAAARLQKAHDALAAQLAKLSGGGTAQEQAELADLQTQIQNAEGKDSGQVSALLAIRPGPDGSAITSQISTLRANAKAARQDLHQAVADAKKLRAALKS